MDENIDFITRIIAKNKERNDDKNLSVLLNGESNRELIDLLQESNLPTFYGNFCLFAPDGYVGFHLDDILKRLLEETGGDLDRAQRGVVVLEGFENWSTNENYIKVVPSKDDLEQRKMILIEKEKRSVEQACLVPYLRGENIPIDFNGRDLLFSTSQLTFILFGKYNEEDFQYDSLGYDKSLMDSILPNFVHRDEAGVKVNKIYK